MKILIISFLVLLCLVSIYGTIDMFTQIHKLKNKN
jgi:hypothetical protein